jgi:hypothetical protein
MASPLDRYYTSSSLASYSGLKGKGHGLLGQYDPTRLLRAHAWFPAGRYGHVSFSSGSAEPSAPTEPETKEQPLPLTHEPLESEPERPHSHYRGGRLPHPRRAQLHQARIVSKEVAQEAVRRQHVRQAREVGTAVAQEAQRRQHVRQAREVGTAVAQEAVRRQHVRQAREVGTAVAQEAVRRSNRARVQAELASAPPARAPSRRASAVVAPAPPAPAPVVPAPAPAPVVRRSAGVGPKPTRTSMRTRAHAPPAPPPAPVVPTTGSNAGALAGLSQPARNKAFATSFATEHNLPLTGTFRADGLPAKRGNAGWWLAYESRQGK